MIEQRMLPGIEQQLSLPFPTMEVKGKRYKVFGIVTNIDGGQKKNSDVGAC